MVSSSGTRTRGPQRGSATSTRGVHVVDTALMLAEIRRTSGASRAAIARQHRKSPGYVSVLCRLGDALRPLQREHHAALRVRHVTFKSAQAIVSQYTRPDDIVAALDALAAAPPSARRRRSAGAPSTWRVGPVARPDEDRLDPVPVHPDVRQARTADFVFQWDQAKAARDPEAILEQFEAFVRAATDEVVDRLRRRRAGEFLPVRPRERGAQPDRSRPDVDKNAAARLDVSLRQLDARITTTLRAHREKMAAFLAAQPPRPAGRGLLTPPAGTAHADASHRASEQHSAAPARGADEITAEDIAADLAD